MQFLTVVRITALCVGLAQAAPHPQFQFYNPYIQPQYYNPYIRNYGYNQPYYMPSYNPNPYMYQQSSLPNNNQVGDAVIVDVEDANSASNEHMQNWLKYYQNLQQNNQEQLQTKAKQVEEEKKRFEEVTGQSLQQTVEIVTTKPSTENNEHRKQIIKLGDGRGHAGIAKLGSRDREPKVRYDLVDETVQDVQAIDKIEDHGLLYMAITQQQFNYVWKIGQIGESFHETITSKPIVHTFTETKPIISRIHRVFTSDGGQPIIKVFYNGKDITDEKPAIDDMENKKLTTASYSAGIATTTEEDSDASDEDDDDDTSAPKPITSWFG